MGYNILLVDDDQTQLKILDRMIANKVRYQTSLASSGEEAIKILASPKANEIDLVLLDLAMPGTDGIGVLKHIRAIRPTLRFVVRSGYDDVKMVATAMKEGAVDYIHKFESAEKLRHMVEKNLQRKITHAPSDHQAHDQNVDETAFTSDQTPSIMNYTQIEEALFNNTRHMLELERADGECKSLSELEREAILHALEKYNYHMSNVARYLAIGRSTLYRKLDEYHIEYPKQARKDGHNKIK